MPATDMRRVLRGWPVLVAAGRRRDYSTLLAPDFLVAELDFGVLETVMRPAGADDIPVVVEARTGAGRQLSVVYATHLMPDIRDEHGRPLRVIYGFASPDAHIEDPDPADLKRALDAGLTMYRRFLADEEGATVAGSAAFALRSVARPLAAAEPAASHPRVPVGLAAIAVAVMVVAAVVTVLALVFVAGNRTPAKAPVVCASASTVDGRATPVPSCEPRRR
jgi:hypothetical protein